MGDVDASGRELTGEIGALHSRVIKLEQVSHELTRHKNVDEELDKAWHEWETTFDATKDSIILTDNEFRIIQANLAASQLFGKSLDEIIGKTCWHLVHGIDHPPKECPLKRAKDSKKHEEIEIYLPQKGIWATDSVDPILDEQDGLTGAVHIIRDITKRKRAEESLQESKEFLENLIASMRDGFSVLDNNGVHIQVNPALCRMTGFSREELLGTGPPHLYWPQEEYKHIEASFQRTLRGDFQDVELVFKRKSGQRFPVIVSPSCTRDKDGKPETYFATVKDITDRKQAERLLRKERDRAQQYLDIAGVMFVAIDAEQRVGLINKKGCQILGYSEEEVIAKNWFDNFLPQTVREQVRAVFQKVVRGELDSLEYYEKPILTKNGQERLISWHNTVLRDDKGRVIAALSSGEDITERKKAEEALRETTQTLQALIQASPLPIFAVDRELIVKTWNPAAERTFGWGAQEVIGRKYPAIPEEKMDEADALFSRALESGLTEVETLRQRKDGSLIDVSISAAPLRDSCGNVNGVMAVLTDITERKRAEQEIAMLAKFPEENPHPVLRISADGTVLYSNKAGFVLLDAWGCRVGQSLPGHLHQLVSGAPDSGRPQEIETKCGDCIFFLTLAPVVDSGYVNVYGLDITEKKLAKQKLLENRAQLKSLASQLTLAEEQERRRLAMELHDRISQALVISKIKLEALRKSGRSRKLDKSLEDVCNSIGQTIQDTRTLTLDLGNPVLYELGFEIAVSEWLTGQIQEKHGLTVEFEDDGQPKPLDDDVRILLFRDVRELLINVVKHAGAHKVKVSISKLDNHICVTVEDDGVGFDPVEVLSTAAKKGEFGLFSIRERLEDLGGHLQIDSAPGQRCKVTMKAPLKQKEMTR
jgi:PAS domain S-box-containing protein